MRPSMMRPVEVDRRVSLRREPRHWRSLLALLAVTFGAGLIGALASPRLSERAQLWHATLSKPAWMPPDALFGAVWPPLYALMAFAAWLVWRERRKRIVQPALNLYFLQLALNVVWPFVYFGMRAPAAAAGVLIALLVAVGYTIRAFGVVHRAAAVLMAPYFGWLVFAGALNVSIWWLNR